mgnify:CR=1 FL=1
MKPNRSPVFTVLMGAGTLLASVVISPAQLLSESTKNDSVVAIVADSQGLPLVPREELPWFGTFWVVRNSVPSIIAPLPCPPLNQSYPVYAITSRQFLVDETDAPLVLLGNRKTSSLTSADYEAIVTKQIECVMNHVTWIQEAALRAEMRAMGLEVPPLPGGEGGGDVGEMTPPVYLFGTNLCLYPPIVTSQSITIAITNAPDSGYLTNTYDLFFTTNLASLPEPALCVTNWAWSDRSTPGQTNFVFSNPGFSECYFRLGTMLDSDGDGLTDAYELLVSHTDPANWDTDGDGLSDGWEVQNGMNPRVDESAQTSGRMNYQYDGSGWLRVVSGTAGEGITLDNEGNVLIAQ